MALVPKWPFVVAALVIGVGVGAAGMSWWDADEIADRDVRIAELERDAAVVLANQSQAALSDLETAARAIKESAAAAQVSNTSVLTKLDTIDRRFRNAKPPAPLPADCRPGTERVRRLTEGAAAVNQAIARPVPGQ